MAGASKAIHRGIVIAQRQLASIGDEMRTARVSIGASQQHLGLSCGMSRQRYGRIESGRCATLSIVELSQIASILGLRSSVRLYPAGLPVRDAAQAARLSAFLGIARPPLRSRVEVALPRVEGGPSSGPGTRC